MTVPGLPSVAVAGYASLDHVLRLDGVPVAGRTTTVVERARDAWPRLGGSPAYVVAALAQSGVDAAWPLTWVGADAEGQAYRDALRAQGIDTRGIEIVSSLRTPIAVLAYQPDGGCLCLYDPGTGTARDQSGAGALRLSGAQPALIAAATWACLTIGPPGMAEAVLDILPADARLAWVVKNDPASLTPSLAHRLAARADLVCCSGAESALVLEALSQGERAGQIRIETHGGEGAWLTRSGTRHFAPARTIHDVDTTGAGDTFAGGVLASLAIGETDPQRILRAGHDAAHRMLARRQSTSLIQKES